jgi:DNA replicative helicase MCM subunit Mcm2 (Cdc46/Mcm family)
MRKVISMIAGLALVCFTTMVFAADATMPTAAAAAAAKASAKAETVKAVNGETVVGAIKKIDTAAKTIVVQDKTINVKAEDLATLKKGDKVKVTLTAGTMNAEKVVSLEKKAAKKAAKKEVKKAEEKATQKAAEKAVEKIGQ